MNETTTQFDEYEPVKVQVNLNTGETLKGGSDRPWGAVVDALYPNHFEDHAIGIRWDEIKYNWSKWNAKHGTVEVSTDNGWITVGTWKRVSC